MDTSLIISREKVPFKGKLFDLPAISFNGLKIIVKGRFLKIAEVRDEWDTDVECPQKIALALANCGTRIDLFSFVQRLPESRPKYEYFMEWDNVAAIPISTYDNWLKKQIPKQTRNRLKKSKKAGVEIRQLELSDEFFNGISEIYNETPIRQGKKNWHYKMPFEKVKQLNSTFSDRCTIIGAYLKNEFIGYIKIVYSDKYARTMGILSKISYRDKYPMNSLIAKAIETCATKKVPYLTYAKYDYGKVGSDTLQDFKKNCGFEHIIIPRYYIPLTLIGKLSLRTGLYKGLKNMLPKVVINTLLSIRSLWYRLK